MPKMILFIDMDVRTRAGVLPTGVLQVCGSRCATSYVFSSIGSDDHVSGTSEIRHMCAAAGLEKGITATDIRHYVSSAFHRKFTLKDLERKTYYEHFGHSSDINEGHYQTYPAELEMKLVKQIRRLLHSQQSSSSVVNGTVSKKYFPSDSIITDSPSSDCMITDSQSDHMITDYPSDRIITNSSSYRIITDSPSDRLITDSPSSDHKASDSVISGPSSTVFRKLQFTTPVKNKPNNNLHIEEEIPDLETEFTSDEEQPIPTKINRKKNLQKTYRNWTKKGYCQN